MYLITELQINGAKTERMKGLYQDTQLLRDSATI